jgi:hypothetical protein
MYFGQSEEIAACRDQGRYLRKLTTLILFLTIVSYFYFLYYMCFCSVISCLMCHLWSSRGDPNSNNPLVGRVPLANAMSKLKTGSHDKKS